MNFFFCIFKDVDVFLLYLYVSGSNFHFSFIFIENLKTIDLCLLQLV